MVIIGRIYEIVDVSEKYAQIVLRKKMNDKVVPVAIGVFGYWRDKIIKEMKLKPKDKIKGNIYMKPNQFKGKWYTDVYFKEVYLVEEAPRPMGANQPNIEDIDEMRVDTETGEIFE